MTPRVWAAAQTSASFLPGDVDLTPVHEFNDVGHRLPLQLQAKVLESEDNRGLDVLFAKLVLEEPAAGRHDHLVHVDVMILAHDVQVHEAGLRPQLLELLAENPAVVLDQDAHRRNRHLVLSLSYHLCNT